MEFKGVKYVKRANMWVARRSFNTKGKADLIFFFSTETEAKAKLKEL